MLEYYTTLVRLRAHEGHPYIALTGELWVSFQGHVQRSDRDISGAFCIVVYIVLYRVWCYFCGVRVWCIIDISAGHTTPLGCWYSGHVTYIDIKWILIIERWFKLRQCVFSEKPWHPTWVYESLTLLAMLVLILLVLCWAGLWSPRLQAVSVYSLFEAIWLLLLLPIRCCLSFCWMVYWERNMIYGNGLDVCLKMWYILCLSDCLCPSRFQAITSGIWCYNDIL